MPTSNPFEILPGYGTAQDAPPPLLSSRSTTPDYGFMPSGGGAVGMDAGGSTKDWGGIAGAAAPLLLSLFGDNPYKAQVEKGANTLQKSGGDLIASGKGLGAQGNDALAPVLAYLKALTGGDRQAELEAAAPARARVIDQYDTAKRSLQFAPRGGGQASAGVNLETKKASDLAVTTNAARNEAIKEEGQLGQNLVNIGGTQQAEGMQGIEGALRAFESLSKDQSAGLAGLGSAIGKALPLLFAL